MQTGFCCLFFCFLFVLLLLLFNLRGKETDTQRWSEGGREGVRDGQMFYLSADSLRKSLEQPELRQLKVRNST